MKIIAAYPPNYAEIKAAFGAVVCRPGVIFTYGKAIYCPSGRVTPQLVAHEHVHSLRQGDDPEGWWRRYISDRAFRLAEEIPAHQAEYRAHGLLSRNLRRFTLATIAKRLSSPLYGSLISFEDAKVRISGDIS